MTVVAAFGGLGFFVTATVYALLGGFVWVVGSGIAGGRVVSRGLLADKTTRRLSPERLQLLLLTIAGAGYYLLLVAEGLEGLVRGGHPRLPDVPDELLAVLLGSNGYYLTAKAASASRFVHRSSSIS